MAAFDFADCWTLLSIGFGRKGSNLAGIISSSDALNHAVIEYEELSGSLNKLMINGYIDFDGKRFRTTEKARFFYREHRHPSEGCIAELYRLSQIFAQLPALDGPEVIRISKDDYNRAAHRIWGLCWQ